MVQSARTSPDALLKAAEKLSPRQLDSFVNRVLRLRAKRNAPSLSQKETKLFLQINRTLSLATQQRLDALTQKRRDETLTPREHAELIRITDRIERINADRVEALAELAELRGVTFQTLADELGIGKPANG